MPDTFHSLNYHDDRLLNQMREAFLAGGGGVSPAVQQAINNAVNNAVSALTPFHEVSVTLDNSQILTLPSSPVVVVPETETINYSGTFTKVPIIIRGAIHWVVREGTPYGNINVPNFGIFLGNDALGVGPVSYTYVTTFFNTDDFQALLPFGISSVCLNGLIPKMDPWQMKDSSHDNGLYLGIQFNVGNLTGGHATNKLRVSLVYQVYNLLTGEFE